MVKFKQYWLGRFVLLAAFATGMVACVDTGLDADATPEEVEIIRSSLKEALRAGSAPQAFDAINELESKGGEECDLIWGRVHATLLSDIDKLNELLKPLEIFLAPGAETQFLTQAETDIVGDIIRNIISKFEEDWDRIRLNASLAVEKDCTFDVEGGIPWNVGIEGTNLYASLAFGDVWQSDEARAFIAGFSALSAAVNFVISHDLVFDQDVFSEVLDLVRDIGDDNQDEIDATAASTEPVRHSYIPQLRPFAGIFDLLPDFLAFSSVSRDFSRFGAIDNTLVELFTAVYDRSDSGESGIIPDWLAQDVTGAAAGQHVAVLVDEDDSGTVTEGDRLVIGLRYLNAANILIVPETPQGIHIILPDFGDIEAIVTAAHEIIYRLGQQVQRVDDASVPVNRIGLDQINEIISAIPFVASNVDLLPEVVEIDIGGYFGADDSPRPIRDFLPYWYDHDDDVTTIKHFMVEGESNVGFADDYVYNYDATHFTLDGDSSFIFSVLGDAGESIAVEDVRIAPDKLFPTVLDFPLPYVAWQDASFNSTIWTDAARLPEIGDDFGVIGFEPADNYELNTIVTWFILKAIDTTQSVTGVPAP